MSRVSTDPIADMLTRIRNAVAVRQSEVTLPHSKIKESVARLLKQNRFIEDIKVNDLSVGKAMTIVINQPSNGAHITEIVRLSKPGRRTYSGVKTIPVVKRGRGIVIVSTSKGLMTGNEAKKQGLGGELICKVY
ncbi:MAG TPA: 30S ribosomal protein S8 [Candidatus Saccharimonadales bacterium]|nr:30S ribosomal protein S8 [Candidatus Saccharimonadales bacterium]